MDKFRLRASLGKIKELHLKLNKTKKMRNDSNMSDFLSSPFPPVMVDLAAGKFLKIEARVQDLWLDMSSGPKWPKCNF